MRKQLAVLALLALYIPASAAPYSVDDFAHSAILSEAKTSLREIAIPKTLYEKMQRRDYGDLRVFSADGQIVPHQFSQSLSRVDSKQETPLVFYPFSKEQAANPSKIQVIINQRAGEQSLQINQHLVNNGESPKINEYQYILINKSENQTKKRKGSPKLCKLRLDWKQEISSSIISFRLESSEQLQSWKTLSHKLTVSKLNYSGSKLLHNQVQFSCTSQKYLRLTWLQPKQQTQLIQIKGLYTKKGEQQIQWQRFGKPHYSVAEKAWLFESNIIVGISKLEFIAPQDGLLYKGTLYSRNNEKAAWRYRKEVSQYRLNMGDTILQSNPIAISPNNDRFWKLKMQAEAQFTENQLPEIKAGWMPKQLHFLAQGKGPFTVAFGNYAITSNQENSLSDLIDSIKRSGVSIDRVNIGTITNNNKMFKTEEKTPWKLILLWLMLILGTALMGYMAYRLFQQMSMDEAEDKNT